MRPSPNPAPPPPVNQTAGGSAPRPGITLIELVLVMALLVVIGSIIVPVFTSGFSSVRLRRAGDQVISSCAKARARAIETGEIYQLRFTPETGAYCVEPWTAAVEEERRPGAAATGATPVSPPNQSSTATSSASAATTADGLTTPNNKALPGPIVFHGGQIAVDDPLQQERRVDSLESAGGALSEPILFYPDGTSSQASLALVNDSQLYVRITLRGLTGVARASDVLTRDELERASRGR